VEARLRRDRRVRTDAHRRGDDPGQVLDARSPKEQLRRFESRAADPLRQWKLTEEDWRNREKRPQYEAAVEDMLDRTDHPTAPWHVVAGDDKRTARVTVVETVCAAVEDELTERGYDLSDPAGRTPDPTD